MESAPSEKSKKTQYTVPLPAYFQKGEHTQTHTFEHTIEYPEGTLLWHINERMQRMVIVKEMSPHTQDLVITTNAGVYPLSELSEPTHKQLTDYANEYSLDPDTLVQEQDQCLTKVIR